jgi:hypothetical protein
MEGMKFTKRGEGIEESREQQGKITPIWNGILSSGG